MAGPRHALTLRSEGQRSNHNPNPRFNGFNLRDGDGPGCAATSVCMSTRLHISLVNHIMFIIYQSHLPTTATQCRCQSEILNNVAK